MKEYCVNKSKFDKCLGYGSWSIITTVLLVFLTASIIEFNSIYEEDPELNEYPKRDCYDSVLFDETKCYGYYSMENKVNERMSLFTLTNLVNFAFIGLFIYFKQQKFKVKWCENNE